MQDHKSETTQSKWPRACHEIRAPFSENYCLAWLLFHGGIFFVGLLTMVIGLNTIEIVFAIGCGIMVVVTMLGAINYLADRRFRKG